MSFSFWFKRTKLKWFLLQHESDVRDRGRVERQEKIRTTKKQLVVDLMTGHNIGDFTMNEEDFRIIVRNPYTLSTENIMLLHKKYRGV
jgi:hypothetical protein